MRAVCAPARIIASVIRPTPVFIPEQVLAHTLNLSLEPLHSGLTLQDLVSLHPLLQTWYSSERLTPTHA
jgi:hypothetical protein